MAKQRRERSRAQGRSAAAPRRPAPSTPPARPATPAPPPIPARTATYPEALAVYERAIHALQSRRFDEAAAQFRELLGRFPEERELHDRARLYLRVCERELSTTVPEPRTLEERLVAATVAINAGDHDRALTLLARVLEEAPDHDHARYMAAVAHALRHEPEAALDQLRRAIDLNAENRALARQDPDLASLHALPAFRELLEAPAPPAGARRRRR